jgi:hypothetical protein
VGARIVAKSGSGPILIIFFLLAKVETQSTYLCDEDDDHEKQKIIHLKHQGCETTPKHLMIILKPKPTHILS